MISEDALIYIVDCLLEARLLDESDPEWSGIGGVKWLREIRGDERAELLASRPEWFDQRSSAGGRELWGRNTE